MNEINCFDGQYAFLSNFYPVEVRLDGEVYATVEHAYQAAKTIRKAERYMIQYAPTPGKAKRLGRKVTLREDWEQVKIHVMLHLLRQKFSVQEFKLALLATQDATLIEGNNHGDTFWGQVDGQGSNQLGLLLMHVRTEIQEGKTIQYIC